MYTINSLRSCNTTELDNAQITCEQYQQIGQECWEFDVATPGYYVDPAIPTQYDKPNIRRIGVITIDISTQPITIKY